jgi:hypothetical protein
MTQPPNASWPFSAATNISLSGIPYTMVTLAMEPHSDRLLRFAAFYTDCWHEVRPVRSGYRVVLTYNFMLARDCTGAATSVPPPETRRAGPLHGGSLNQERRLVYDLDHQ